MIPARGAACVDDADAVEVGSGIEADFDLEAAKTGADKAADGVAGLFGVGDDQRDVGGQSLGARTEETPQGNLQRAGQGVEQGHLHGRAGGGDRGQFDGQFGEDAMVVADEAALEARGDATKQGNSGLDSLTGDVRGDGGLAVAADAVGKAERQQDIFEGVVLAGGDAEGVDQGRIEATDLNGFDYCLAVGFLRFHGSVW